jgi:hypothetical protein
MILATTRRLVALGLLFGLALAPAAGPTTAAGANDSFSSAKKITRIPSTDSADTTDATRDSADPTPTCGDPTDSVGHTVWYKLKRRKTTSVEADTFNSDYDTVLAVYTRAGTGEFTEVTCNDDQPPIGQSQVTFTGQRRTIYYIEVGSYGLKDAGHLAVSVKKQTS